MKTVSKLSVVAGLLLAATVAAQAQDVMNDRGVYGGATYTYWNADVNGGDSVDKSVATVKLGYDFNQNWAAEARVNLFEKKWADDTFSKKVGTPFAVYGKYRHPITPTIAPYAVVGLAYNRYKYDEKGFFGGYETSSKLGLSAGVGAEISLTPRLKATVEYTYLGSNSVDGVDYDVNGLSVGLLYKF